MARPHVTSFASEKKSFGTVLRKTKTNHPKFNKKLLKSVHSVRRYCHKVSSTFSDSLAGSKKKYFENVLPVYTPMFKRTFLTGDTGVLTLVLTDKLKRELKNFKLNLKIKSSKSEYMKRLCGTFPVIILARK